MRGGGHLHKETIAATTVCHVNVCTIQFADKQLAAVVGGRGGCIWLQCVETLLTGRQRVDNWNRICRLGRGGGCINFRVVQRADKTIQAHVRVCS